MSFKVLIVGLGKIGMGYDLDLEPEAYVYSHARAFSSHPSFCLVAGVDLNTQNQKMFEQVYDCPTYADVGEAIQYHCPSVVVIALPTLLHGNVLRQLLEQPGIRLVLCEKPLSYDIEEARFMVAECAAKGVQLYVNYMRRSDPGIIEVKRWIDSGKISKPIKGVVWYSKGFLHNGSHFVNLMEYWLGMMKGSKVMNAGRVCNENDPEPDVQVTFEHGVVIFMAAWEEAFSHYTMELLSPSGRLRCERGGKQIQWESVRQDPHMQGYVTLDPEPVKIVSDMDRYQWNVVAELAKVLAGQEAQLCSGLDALKSLEGMNNILKKVSNDRK